MERVGRSGFSLRGVSWTLISAVSVLVVVHLTVFWASQVVWRSAQDLERQAPAVDAARHIDRALWEHQRIGNLSVAMARDPDLFALRAQVESALRAMLAELEHETEEPTERILVAQLEAEVAAYLESARSVRARGLPFNQAAQAVRAKFERALATSTTVRKHYDAGRRESQRNATRATRYQRSVLFATTPLLVLAIGAIGLGVHRLLVQPILNLQDAVQRFRTGDESARAADGPVLETRKLAESFNDMADAIAQRHRDQLTFLAAVAHDLRNPLAGLKLIVRSLEQDPAAATPDRWRRLDRQLDRLTRLVGDLLDATRVESGHLELVLQDFDMRDAAQAVVDVYAPTTSTHVIELTGPGHPLIVHGDPLRIEQVLSNLLNNAIKYSPRGGPIEVSLSTVENEAVLAVSDHGVGVPPAEIPKLFLPFHRREDAADLAPGVGLGLSIVRRIVEAHGGRIEVDSKPGVGSTFRVRLPMRATTERDAGQPWLAEPVPPPLEPR